MEKVISCDKCGIRKPISNIEHGEFENDDGSIQKYDLCANCYKQFRQLLIIARKEFFK